MIALIGTTPRFDRNHPDGGAARLLVGPIDHQAIGRAVRRLQRLKNGLGAGSRLP
jgi:hypothetical protein